MEERDYISQIDDCEREIIKLRRKITEIITAFKRDVGCEQGDRIILRREIFNVESGNYDQQEYNLFIKSSKYDHKMRKLVYKFQYVSPNGRPSDAKCSVYHQPLTDTIIKCS